MSQFEKFYIEISGLCVEMNARYKHVFLHCKDYISDNTAADIKAFATEEQIAREMQGYEGPMSEGYCEDICLYRSIAEQLPALDRLVFHGAAVSIAGRGFIFTAPSGTGKTTHINLLMKNYPDDVKIINGDKPIIHLAEDGARVCSTPWAGKENYNRNTIEPLAGICIVRRAPENAISRIDPARFFGDIFRQVYLPINAEARIATLDLLDKLAVSVPFYLLECNISDNAAETSYGFLK